MATRDELRSLANLRLKEAEALFAAGLYDGCVYLCGYVVELALKARICTLLGVSQYPEEKMKAFKTHDFDELLLLAGLENEISVKSKQLNRNWSKATAWKPEWRYRPAGKIDRGLAQGALDAIRADPDGVFTWLRKRW